MLGNILVQGDGQGSCNSLLSTLVKKERLTTKVILDLYDTMQDELLGISKLHFKLHLIKQEKFISDTLSNIRLILENISKDCYLIINGVELLTTESLRLLNNLISSHSFKTTVIATQSINIANNEDAVTYNIVNSLDIKRKVLLEYHKNKPFLSEDTNIDNMRALLLPTNWWK